MDFIDQLNLPSIVTTFQPSLLFLGWAFFYLSSGLLKTYRWKARAFFFFFLPVGLLLLVAIINVETFAFYSLTSPNFSSPNPINLLPYEFIHWLYQLVGINWLTTVLIVEGDASILNHIIIFVEIIGFSCLVWFLFNIFAFIGLSSKKYTPANYKKVKPTPLLSFTYGLLIIPFTYVLLLIGLELFTSITQWDLSHDVIYGLLKQYIPFELLVLKLRELANLLEMPF